MTPPHDAPEPELEFDPHLLRAINKAQARYERSKTRWSSRGDEEDDEAGDDARRCASDALARLRAQAWDEAETLAQEAVELDEQWRAGEIWREFAILVEEAAAVGRGS